MGSLGQDEFHESPDGLVFFPRLALSQQSQLLGREAEIVTIRGNVSAVNQPLVLPACRRIYGSLSLNNASLVAPVLDWVMIRVDLKASRLVAPQLVGPFHLAMTTTSEFAVPRILRTLDIIKPFGQPQPLRMPNLIVVANAINGFMEQTSTNGDEVELIAPRLRLIGSAKSPVKLICPEMDADSHRGAIRLDHALERMKAWHDRYEAIEAQEQEALALVSDGDRDGGLAL